MITQTVLRADTSLYHPLDILLAEDNLVNQKLAVRLLENRGHAVTVVDNGREAVDMTEKRTFDLVLMDVQMPEMDGISATTNIRAREKVTQHYQPIVAMTALVMQGDRDRCLGAQMDGYLSKPLRPAELDDVLDLYSARKHAIPQSSPTQTRHTLSAVDGNELLERVDGDLTFIAELSEIFRDEYPRQIQTVSTSIAHSDADGLKRNAHALKGALANLSAKHAATLAASLERLGTYRDLATAQALLDELEKELPRVVASLDELCREPVL